MRKLTVILSFLTFGAFGQQFPSVKDSIVPNGTFATTRMIEGGFELIGVSQDYTTFDLSNVEQLYQNHLHRSVRFIFDNGESEIIYEEDLIFETIDFEIDIPPTEQPPPPISNLKRKYSLGEHLRIIVDTSQIVSIPNYTDNSFIHLHEGETIHELEFNSLSKHYRSSTKMVEGYPILIENISDSVRNIETQEGGLYIIQEALNEHGNWLPIEYIDYRAVCGNSFGNTKLLPDEYLLSKIYKYNGDYQTKIRIKFATHKKVYFSNEFTGRINITQFELSEYLINRTEKLNEHFLTN